MLPTTKEGWDAYAKAGVYRGPDPLASAEDADEFLDYLKRGAEARQPQEGEPKKDS